MQKVNLQELYIQLSHAVLQEDYRLCAIIQKELQRRCKVTKLPPFKTTKELEVIYKFKYR